MPDPSVPSPPGRQHPESWNMEFAEAARLLNQTSYYLYKRAEYSPGEPLYRRALAIKEKALGPKHPSTVKIRNNLIYFYREQGRDAEADALKRKAP